MDSKFPPFFLTFETLELLGVAYGMGLAFSCAMPVVSLFATVAIGSRVAVLVAKGPRIRSQDNPNCLRIIRGQF